MKFLATQAGAFLTTASVADAVMKYWLTLAEDDRTDVVHVPYLTEANGNGTLSITLSRATGLVAYDADDIAHSPLDDSASLADLTSRIRAARLPVEGVAFDGSTSALTWSEF